MYHIVLDSFFSIKFFIFIFIGVELIYNIVLVSGVHQSESVIHIHTAFLFQILFPYRSLQNIEQSSLCYIVGLYQLSIIYVCREGNGNPLQDSCLENPMDRGAWQAAVHGIAKSQTRLSDFTFTFHFHVSKKEMATHFSVLAWRIPGMREPGGLPSMGSHRVRHD